LLAICDFQSQWSKTMDVAEEMRLTKHQRYWLDRIQACEASGKRITAYAAEHGFPVRVMYDAKKVLVKKGVLPRTQGIRFQRAEVIAISSDSEWRVRLPNGVSVDFSGTVDAGSLSTVLTTAAQLE
jgi:hypothetical protein